MDMSDDGRNRAYYEDALDEALAGARWQPIESAPRGVDVLIALSNEFAGSGIPAIAIGALQNGIWAYHAAHAHGGVAEAYVTHWMPLPDGPE